MSVVSSVTFSRRLQVFVVFVVLALGLSVQNASADDALETTITSGPENGWTSTASVTWEFSTTTGVSFECRLDDAPFTACASPYTTPVLENGHHTFEVRAVDAQSATDPTPASRSVYVEHGAVAQVIDNHLEITTLDGHDDYVTTFGNDPYFSVYVWSPPWPSGVTAGPGCVSVSNSQVDCLAPDLAGISIDTGDGNDTIWQTASTPGVVDAGGGDDFLAGLNSGDILIDGPGADTLGHENLRAATADYSDRSEPLSITMDNTANDAGEGDNVLVDNVISGSGADTITGSERANSITGGAGADTVSAGTGDDQLNMRDYTADSVTCGDGQDSVLADASDDLTDGPACETVDAASDLPETTISFGPEEASTVGSWPLVFEFDSDTGVAFECSWDEGSAWEPCGPLYDLYGIPNGSWQLQVRAIDAEGRTDATPVVRSFSVGIAPTAYFSEHPGPIASGGTTTASFYSDDPAHTYECALDGGSFAVCTSPFTAENLSIGPHRIDLRVTDSFGYSGTVIGQTFHVFDPADAFDFDPQPPARTGDRRPTFGFTSDANFYGFRCQIRRADETWPTSDMSCGYQYTLAYNLNAGDYVLTVWPVDYDMQQLAYPKEAAFTVDLEAPSVEISNPVEPGTTTTDTSRSVEFQSSSVDLQEYTCSVNETAPVACTSPFLAENLSECMNTISVLAIDTAGNAGRASTSVTVDSQPSRINSAIKCPGDEFDIEEWLRGYDGGVPEDFTPEIGYTGSVDGHEMPFGAALNCRVNDREWEPCGADTAYSPRVQGPGPHTFSVRNSYDGEVDPHPATISFESTWEAVEPETTIDIAPPAIGDASTATLEFDSNKFEATFECKVDAGPWTACASPHSIDFTALGAQVDGDHTVSVRATAFGITDESPADTTFRIASRLRVPSITSGPGDGDEIDAADATFEFTSTSGAASYECSLDGAFYVPCVSPFTVTSPPAGRRSIAIRGIALDGSAGPVARREFVFVGAAPTDTQAPETTIESGPADGSTITGDSPRFEFNSTEPGLFSCTIDGGAATSCDSPFDLPPLSDGQHTFTVAATDLAGNADASPAARNFGVAVDQGLRPDTLLDRAPTPPHWNWIPILTDPEPEFEFHSTATGARFECRLDAGEWQACDSPYRSSVEGTDPEAVHSFEVRSIANQLTDDTPAQLDFHHRPPTHDDLTVDRVTVDPVTSEETRTPFADNTVLDAGNLVLAIGSQVGGYEVSGRELQCSLDGEPFAICVNRFTRENLAEGAHRFVLRTPEADGHLGVTTYRGFTVDPTTSEGAGQGVTSGIAIAFGPDDEEIVGSEAAFGFSTSTAGATFECRVDEEQFQPCASPYTTPSMSEGSHTFEIRERRADNSVTQAVSRRFTAPVIEYQFDYDEIVEQGPDGDQLTLEATDQVKLNLAAMLGGGTSSEQGLQSFAASGAMAGPDPDRVLAFLEEVGAMPSKGQFLEDFFPAGVTKEIMVDLSAVLPDKQLVYELFGGDYASLEIGSEDAYPHFTKQVLGWGYSDTPSPRMVITGIDGGSLSPACSIGQAACWDLYSSNYWTKPFATGSEFEPDCWPPNASGQGLYPIRASRFGDTSWGSLGSPTGHFDYHVQGVNCLDDSEDGEDAYPYIRVLEWLTLTEAWDAFLVDTRVEDCGDEPCQGIALPADALDRKKAAAMCAKEEWQDVCSTSGTSKDDTAIGEPDAPEGDPVDVVSGNFTASKEDLAATGFGPPLKLARTFNSVDARTGTLGRGWSWAGTAGAYTLASGTVRIALTDGKTLDFKLNSDGTYTAPPGRTEGLTTVIDQTHGSLRVLSDPYGKLITRYLPNGRILDESDNHGNHIAFVYDQASRLVSQSNGTGQSINYTYDASGMVVSATDSNQRTVSFTYLGENLVKVTNAEGGIVRYSYDAGNRIVLITDPDEREVVQNEYDQDGRVVRQRLGDDPPMTFEYLDRATRFVDAAGHEKLYRYDANGKISSLTDFDGGRTEIRRDAKGNELSTRLPDGTTVERSYDPAGRLLAETNAVDATTTFTYDAAGNKTSSTDALGRTTTFVHNATNDLVAVTNPLGRVLTFAYAAPGILQSRTDANGHATTYSRDTAGRIASITDALGGISTREYDVHGNLESTTDPLGNVSEFEHLPMGDISAITDPTGAQTAFEYDGTGNLTSMTNSSGVVSTTSFDDLGRPITQATAGVVTETTAYDAVGNVRETADALGGKSRFARDSMDRVTRETSADGTTTSYRYDELGRLAAEFDVNGNKTAYTYDAVGNLTAVTDAAGGVTHYGYDMVGRLVSRTDARGHTTTYSYDAADQLVTVEQPLGRTTQYTYDDVGNMLTRSVEGEVTAYAYDALDRVTQVTLDGGDTQQFAYDANGQLIEATDELGRELQFTYDEAGRVESSTDAFGYSVQFEYDLGGRLTAQTDLHGTVTSEYDAFDRVTRMTMPNGRVHRFKYDANGNLIQRETLKQRADQSLRLILRRQNFYDAMGRLTRAYSRNADGRSLSRLEYSYDANGNPLRRQTSSGEQEYEYDALDRLTSVEYSTGQSDSFAYDVIGNRTHKNGQPYTYDALNQMLSAPGGKSYTYDPQGRTSSETAAGETTSYAYDSLDRIAGRSQTDGPDLTFEYDALSRLSSTTGDGLTRTYNYATDDRPLTERTQFGAPSVSQIARAKRYDYGPVGLLSVQQGDVAPTYPLTDEHGSILGQVTEQGELKAARDYGPFGEELAGPAAPDPADPLADESFDYLGAHGRAGVYGSDQIHMGARIYDPQTGRFISRDPLPGTPGNPQTQNPYAYGLNSPGRYYDLDGRFVIAIPIAVIEVGILVGVTVGAVWCATNGDQCAEYSQALYEKGKEVARDGLDRISKDPKTPDGDGKGSGGSRGVPIPKADSPLWKGLKPFRGKTKTNGLSGKKREYYEWDHTHGEIEVYDRFGRHKGTMDPDSGVLDKGKRVPGREINVK